MKHENDFLENMWKNPSNWKGPFYFNRKDPRLHVPKITGMGWTLNFASPYSWLFMIAVVLIIIASQFLF